MWGLKGLNERTVIVYHPAYIFGSSFLNRFHPFEFDRAQKALQSLRKDFGSKLDGRLHVPEQIVTFESMEWVHTADYLKTLKSSAPVAAIMETPFLGWLPYFFHYRWFVKPTLWGVSGTMLATELAREHGWAYNLGGGYHHAKRSVGDGFCMLSDIALSIETERLAGRVGPEDSVFYIDLDVHQGNGVSHYYKDDPKVRILDVFNGDIYPIGDYEALEGVDVSRPLKSRCEDENYLRTVAEGLEELFDVETLPKMVIYNAGTDIFEEDRLGHFKVSRSGVTQRDMMVFEKVRAAGIPLVILSSGGYSTTSALLMADFANQAIRAS